MIRGLDPPIAMLVHKGRVRIGVPLQLYLRELQARFRPLPLAGEIAAICYSLPLPQADSFDRVIVATARTLGLPLLTRDRNIAASGLAKVIW